MIWKLYGDYEKEEKWLHVMAAKGLALHSYSWGRYVFEDSVPGEFVYRIELLKNLPSSPEGREYLNFLEETGVICVAMYFRWVYLRKPSEAGPFDLYTDVDSRLAHYRNIAGFWNVTAFLEFFAAALFVGLGVYHVFSGDDAALWYFLSGSAFFVLGCLFYSVGRRPRLQARKLFLERSVRA